MANTPGGFFRSLAADTEAPRAGLKDRDSEDAPLFPPPVAGGGGSGGRRAFGLERRSLSGPILGGGGGRGGGGPLSLFSLDSSSATAAAADVRSRVYVDLHALEARRAPPQWPANDP